MTNNAKYPENHETFWFILSTFIFFLLGALQQVCSIGDFSTGCIYREARNQRLLSQRQGRNTAHDAHRVQDLTMGNAIIQVFLTIKRRTIECINNVFHVESPVI